MKLKTLVVGTLVVLVLFFVISNPSHAATMVQGVLNFLKHGAEAIIAFVSNIFR